MEESYRGIIAECPKCGENVIMDEMDFSMNSDDIQTADAYCEKCEHEFKVKHPDY